MNIGSLEGQGDSLARIGTELARARFEADRMRQTEAQAKRSLEEASDRQDEAVQGFEEIFSRMLASELRRGLGEGFFGEGPGSETFSSWLDEFVGKAIAERGTLGIERMIEEFAAHRTAEQAEATEPIQAVDAGGDS